MTREEKQISTWLNDSLKPIHAGSDLFGRIQKRLETRKTPAFHWYGFAKKAIPVTLALLIIVSFVFPVFGSNGNLMDLYYNYRFQRNISNLRNVTDDELKGLENVNIRQSLFNTILEEQYKANPAVIQYLRSHNMDPIEILVTLYIAQKANMEPIDIVGLRNQNISWGRIIRRFRITPRQAFLQMRLMQNDIHQKIIVPVQKKLLIRGRIESFLPDRQILVLENANFFVYLDQNTTSNVKLSQGAYVQVSAYYSLDTQQVLAEQIHSYNPQEVGIMTLTGEVIRREGNKITLRLLDQSVLQIILPPRILNSPLSPLIRSSLFVRVVAVKGQHNELIAYSIRKLIPPPSVWKETNP